MNYKNDFPMLQKDIVYFDNGATSLKPKCVMEKMDDYYYNYSSNAHRGDYKISLKASSEYEKVRDKVKNFINAEKSEEIVFTSGSTDSLNMIIYGYFKYNLNMGDEVLITKAEHASNILPWFELSKDIGINVKYIPLTENHMVTIEIVINSITEKTKVISLAHITNVIGDMRPIKKIVEYAHSKGILVVVDGAQSVGHTKVDVRDLNVDFLAFSAHKMLGPTGVGVLYGKYDLLDKIKPIRYGGGMNVAFSDVDNVVYKDLPYRLEAGTQNIAGVIGFGPAIDYINEVGIDNIEESCDSLKEYIIKELKKIKHIKLYNENVEGAIVTFNVDKVFAQDTAIYLDKYNICVRSGSHCAKKLEDEFGIKNTCRISIYFYNTKEDADKLINALKNENILEESLGV